MIDQREGGAQAAAKSAARVFMTTLQTVELPRFATLLVEVDQSLCLVTFNRPKKLNALSTELLHDIIRLSHWLHTRDEIRVMIIAGAGRTFSAGFDLSNLNSTTVGESPRASADLGRVAAEALTNVPQLTIAAVHGHCVGGGVVLVAACDLRIATLGATFVIPEVDLGIPLAWGGIPRLVREIGPALTKELVLTCRPFGAQEAKNIGLINRVVEETYLMDHVTELARSLAVKPLFALRSTKQQVNAVMEEIAGTGRSANDADSLMYAMRDPESNQAMARYMQSKL
jgi:enoyl-CoA hydratase/carnithine racemase